MWTAEAYGADAMTPLAAIAAGDRAHQAGHRGRAARRPPAGHARHAGDDRRRARRRRAHDRRDRRVGPADRRRVVRPTLGQAERPSARLHHDPPAGHRARRPGHARRSGDLAAVHRSRRARPGQAAQVDPALAVRHPHLVGVGRPAQHRAVRRAVRRLAADGAAARGHRRPRRRRRARPRLRPAAPTGGAATTSKCSTGSRS